MQFAPNYSTSIYHVYLIDYSFLRYSLYQYTLPMFRTYTILGLNKRGEKSDCIWQPTQLYCVWIIMPQLTIVFLHWFAIFQKKTSSKMKSNSIFQGLVYRGTRILPQSSIICLYFYMAKQITWKFTGRQYIFLGRTFVSIRDRNGSSNNCIAWMYTLGLLLSKF